MRRIDRKKLFMAAALLWAGLAAAGCGGQSGAENGPQEATVPHEKVTSVTVRSVALADLEDTLTLPGTLEAWEDLVLAAELAGPVRWIGPQEGQRLEAGEAILRIDPDTVSASLARAKAESELQRKKKERYGRLAAERLVSQQEYEDACNDFEAAQADLEICRVNMEKSTLKSPVSGVLDRLLVDRGEYVAPGTEAAVVVQVDRLKALVEVPEKDIPFLAVGDVVEVRHAALQGEDGPVIPGRIIHLAFRADPVSRTYRAKVEVANPEGRLRPGMIVRVAFARQVLEQVVAVPLYALVDRDGAKAAFVEEQGVARERILEVGPVIGEQVVIRRGLAAGERLIVKGQQLVSDGASVAAVER